MNKTISMVVAVLILALGHQGLSAATNLVSNVLVVTNQCKTIVTYTMETNGTAHVNDPTGRLIGTAEEAALRVAAEGQGAIASAAQVAAESARWEWDAFIATNDTHIVYIDAGFEQDLPALATNFCGWVASSFYDREKGEDHYYIWFNREIDYPPSMAARIVSESGTNWLDGAWVDWNVTHEVRGVLCRELVVKRRNDMCVLKTGTTITLGGKDGFNADIHNVNIEVGGTPTATTAVSAPFYAVTIDGTNRVVTAYTNGFINVENGFVKEPTVDPSPVPPAPPAFGGLKFTAVDGWAALSIDPHELSLMYSLDGGMTFEVYEGEYIELEHTGDSVCFKAGPGGNEAIRRSFTINSGYVSASGNVNSLLSEDYADVTNIGYRCYEGLFQYCTDLVSAPEICSDSFDWYACIMMFDGCRNLTNTPALTVSRAGDSCFKSMFRGCTSLKSAQPIIFTAPIEGSEVCMGMFEGCTSLESSPLIDFKSFGGGTYRVSRVFEQMFRDCRSLNEIKLTYAGPLTDPTYEYFKYWVADVPSTTGIFYYNGTDRTRGESAIPEGWEVRSFER